MTLVTLAEARENLPDLLRRAAAGEYFVVAQDGKWLGALTAAPAPLHPPMDEAERRRLDEFERLIAQWHAEDGLPYPPVEEAPAGARPESPAA
jgi:antitoxin (DNA-binding transcriptional repressor) of toxin-antitoxin stability system